MRKWLLAALSFGALVAFGQIDADEQPRGDDAMGKPQNAPSWGASWEPTPKPTAPASSDAPWLQPLIDAAPEGGILVLEPKRYAGPAVIQKKLIVDGQGKAVIDGAGKGTVLTLEASDSVLRGVTVTGSGDSHNTDDTCLNVRGHRNVIEGNVFEDCLFGVDLKQANDNQVRKNRVSSKQRSLGLRGDGLRLWYSMNNVVEANEFTDVRDFVVWYSNGNVIRNNVGRRGRYSLHFMFAQHNVVEGNHFEDNSVGIYVMYTDGVEIRNNTIVRSQGAAGMGIGFKEASNSTLEGNSIVYCAIGIGSDLSPFEPDSTITIRHNRIAYNGVGLSFIGEREGTTVEGNVFEGNLDHVAQAAGDQPRTVFTGNYWDDYQGFDRDRNAVGDTPYELYAYADRLWMETPAARFFKNAPLMEALDFLERLAPFSSPTLLVKDEAPRFVRPEGMP